MQSIFGTPVLIERKRRKVSCNGLVTINKKFAGKQVVVTEYADGTFKVELAPDRRVTK